MKIFYRIVVGCTMGAVFFGMIIGTYHKSYDTTVWVQN